MSRMIDVSAVFLVFFALFASGLALPMFETSLPMISSNDQMLTTVPDSYPRNKSVVGVLDEVDATIGKQITHEPILTSTAKKMVSLGDRLFNRIKERSVVKIIKKCKRPRYKPRDSYLEDMLFSAVVQNVSNNTVTFHEIYNSEQLKNMYVTLKPSPVTNTHRRINMTRYVNFMANVLVPQKMNEFVSTSHIPIKSFSNGSDIEIIKNTFLRLNSIPKGDKNDLQNQDTRTTKHQMKKFFKLHSSNVKELEGSSSFNKSTRSAISDNSPDYNTKSDSTAEPTNLSIVEDPYNQALALAPKKQSIVLRWNLILI